MQIEKIRIQNYKSLKDVTFRPGNLSVLVGPNASGKSNFVDALDFLAKTYRHGLGRALQMKGGYEHVVFRGDSKEKQMTFSTSLHLYPEDFNQTDSWDQLGFIEQPYRQELQKIKIYHHLKVTFNLDSTKGTFFVSEEELELYFNDSSRILSYSFNKEDGVSLLRPNKAISESIYLFIKTWIEEKPRDHSSELVFSSRSRTPLISDMAEFISGLSLFFFTPAVCKKPYHNIPDPGLKPAGENLPLVVEWLKTHHNDQWQDVLLAMQDIMTGLEDITTFSLHDNSVGLLFHESGFDKPWYTNQISDGTILALAILVSIADPRRSVMNIIEEPENSVHPWILRSMVERFREHSCNKHIVLTTHSPLLIDHLKPSEILVVSREHGETRITPLLELDPDIQQHWENGKYDLSDLLDSGLLPQAIPGGMW